MCLSTGWQSNCTYHMSNLLNSLSNSHRIDNEVERLHHFKDWKRKQDEKLRKDREEYVEKGFDFNSVTNFQPDPGAAKKIQMRKDKRMARTDPMKYCADRCVATGSCEVWEDMFNMKADEVQQFCNECVLSEDEEPCDVPEKFIENAGLNPWDLHP